MAMDDGGGIQARPPGFRDLIENLVAEKDPANMQEMTSHLSEAELKTVRWEYAMERQKKRCLDRARWNRQNRATNMEKS